MLRKSKPKNILSVKMYGHDEEDLEENVIDPKLKV
jgi:hypothetical protein